MAKKRQSRHDIPSALRLKSGGKIKLDDARADQTHGWEREMAERATAENLQRLAELQYKMYADGRFAMLVVLQAIDGGGKDSTVRRVFSAFNPQGCSVVSFKVPNAEERQHDYMWRIHRRTPGRGEVVIFNRSHYEDVLVVRVDNLVPPDVWGGRYEQINAFEKTLTANGTRIVKIFLQISRAEQKIRFEERLADKRTQWKFDPGDLRKREQWDQYRQAFEAALSKCSTAHAPWHVIPANRKWFRDLAVSQILRNELEQLPLRWPTPAYDPAKIKIR